MERFRMMTFKNKRSGERSGVLIRDLERFGATDEEFTIAIMYKTMFSGAEKCGISKDSVPDDIVIIEEIKDSSNSCWIEARDDEGNRWLINKISGSYKWKGVNK
ncbi:MAG: hypothetical protein ACTSR2_00140 [Candidatus Hodarchaeales archaeon]